MPDIPPERTFASERDLLNAGHARLNDMLGERILVAGREGILERVNVGFASERPLRVDVDVRWMDEPL